MKRQPIIEATLAVLSDADLQALQMGRAAQIPGFQKAIDDLTAGLENLKAEMYEIQNLLAERRRQASIPVIHESHRLEGPKKPRKKRSGIKAYWAGMTAEERSAEMQRRMDVHRGGKEGKGKAKAKLHPRDKEHPGHEAWVAKLRRNQRKTWKNLSPEARATRVKNMAAGRQIPTVAMMRETA